MKLKDIRDDYYSFSGKASDVSRNLGYAGIAVIWALRLGKGDDHGIIYQNDFMWPLILFVFALAFDFLHYLWGTVTTGVVNHSLWKTHQDNEADVTFPNWINRVTVSLFCTKLGLTSLAQISLLWQLSRILLANP